MVARFVELPYPVVCRIIEFLPIVDVVNLSKVCQNWKQIIVKSLKRVKINASTVYGGSWQKFNAGKTAGCEGDIESFARDLANCTDGIEHLYFDGNVIPCAVFDILLSSQKALKTLVVQFRRKDTFDDPETEIGDVVTKGIIRHEKSLEKINIAVEGVFTSFKTLEDAFTHKETCFPNITSIEFLSTMAGSFTTYENDIEDSKSTVEIKSARLLFQKMFTNSQLKELNFKAKPILKLYYDGPETFWNPRYTQLLNSYFKLGSFSNLRKINIDSLNTRGIPGEFSEADADLIIDNCPHISHIDSDLFWGDIDLYRTPVHNDKPFLKIIRHYGPQLVHLHCHMNTNIANCIVENCPNVKTLTIVDFFADGISDSALMALASLQKLKKVTVFFQRFHESSDSLLTFLENCTGRLTKLQLIFQEGATIDEKIFGIIQENCNYLETLIINSYMESPESYKAAMEGFINMLRYCNELRILSLVIDSVDAKKIGRDIYMQYYEKSTQQIISYHANLCELNLYTLLRLPDNNKQTLIESMPFCKIEFDYNKPYCKF